MFIRLILKGVFYNNGLGVYGQCRLVTVLKHLSKLNNSIVKGVRLYVFDDDQDGALIVNNSIVLRFVTKRRNVFLRTIETDEKSGDFVLSNISTETVKGTMSYFHIPEKGLRSRKVCRPLRKLIIALQENFSPTVFL